MLQSSPINVSDFSIFCALNFGVKKCKNHFVNSMMQRTGQKVIKVVNKNSHADVWQKSSSYSKLAVKLISIKQKRKYHFILPGRTRQANQFWFPISISRDFAIYFDGNRTCISVFFLSSRHKSTCYHLLFRLCNINLQFLAYVTIQMT